MRKWNAVLSLAALVLFLIHGIAGSFLLLGPGSTALKVLARGMAVLVLIHTCIGIKYTADSLRVWRRTGAGYFRENRVFWARRISGLAILVFLLFHMTAFSAESEGFYRLQWFNAGKLAVHILLAASLAVHILTNIRPLMLSLGVKGGRRWLGDVLFVLAVLLLFMAAAFVIYYLRWNLW